MGWRKMSKLQKIALAISCFIPLYIVMMLKNAIVFSELLAENGFVGMCIYNLIVIIIWIALSVFGIAGLVNFSKSFLKLYSRSKETIVIDSAKNLTGESFFTYFSFFVLTFFAVDPSSWKDLIILFFLMFTIIFIYIKNDLFFMNPVLNIIGYKSFILQYQKLINGESIRNEIKVYSKLNLCIAEEDIYYLSYSSLDFTICYADSAGKSHKKTKLRK